MTPSALTCADVEALAAELALGTISGQERDAALTHLAGCSRCPDMVDQLAPVADGLLHLAPQADPPDGFEGRVLERVGAVALPLRASHPKERHTRRLAAVAAVALVAALAGAGLALVAEPRRAGADVRTALAEGAGGRWTCRAVVYGTDPAWLFVSLDRRDGASTGFSVQVYRTGNSDPLTVGDLNLQNGHGSLTRLLELPAQDLRSMRVLDRNGRVRYQAKFRSSA